MRHKIKGLDGVSSSQTNKKLASSGPRLHVTHTPSASRRSRNCHCRQGAHEGGEHLLKPLHLRPGRRSDPSGACRRIPRSRRCPARAGRKAKTCCGVCPGIAFDRRIVDHLSSPGFFVAEAAEPKKGLPLWVTGKEKASQGGRFYHIGA
jgi:hypothetical protein